VLFCASGKGQLVFDESDTVISRGQSASRVTRPAKDAVCCEQHYCLLLLIYDLF
jgi:hypothetical protein